MGNHGGAQIEQAVESHFLMLNEYKLSWQQCSRNFFKPGRCGRILAELYFRDSSSIWRMWLHKDSISADEAVLNTSTVVPLV